MIQEIFGPRYIHCFDSQQTNIHVLQMLRKNNDIIHNITIELEEKE